MCCGAVCVVCLMCVFVRMVVCMDSLLCTQMVSIVLFRYPSGCEEVTWNAYQSVSTPCVCVCTSVQATWC